MGDSLTIRTDHAIQIDLKQLTRRVEAVLRLLLNQDKSFLPEFKILKVGGSTAENTSALEVSDDIFSFYECKYLHGGPYFFFNMDPYWSLYSNKPIFQFCITEIKRDFSDISLAVCIAISISVAEIFSSPEIIDGYGVWVQGRDEVSVDKLLSLALKEQLPLMDALKLYYKKIPVLE